MKLKIKANVKLDLRKSIAQQLIDTLYERPINFTIADRLFKRLEIEEWPIASWKWMVGDHDEATHIKNDIINALRHIVNTGELNYQYDLDSLYRAYKACLQLTEANKVKAGLEDSWTRDNESVTLKEILEFSKKLPVEEMPVSALKDYVLSLEDTFEHANLEFPILVLLNNDNSIKFILDGHHRIQKAIKLRLLNIKVKKIIFSTLPDKFKQILGGDVEG